MYSVKLDKKAQKTLNKLPKSVIQNFRTKFEDLANDISKLENIDRITNPKSIGYDEDVLYKLRVSDYRALFIVEHQIITITIFEIEHRSKIYRKK